MKPRARARMIASMLALPFVAFVGTAAAHNGRDAGPGKHRKAAPDLSVRASAQKGIVVTTDPRTGVRSYTQVGWIAPNPGLATSSNIEPLGPGVDYWARQSVAEAYYAPPPYREYDDSVRGESRYDDSYAMNSAYGGGYFPAWGYGGGNGHGQHGHGHHDGPGDPGGGGGGAPPPRTSGGGYNLPPGSNWSAPPGPAGGGVGSPPPMPGGGVGAPPPEALRAMTRGHRR